MDLVELMDLDAARHPWELARYRLVKDIIVEQFEGKKGLNIVDFGCGDVFLIENLIQDLELDEVAAIDIALSEEQLQHFQNRLHNKNTKARIARSLDDIQFETQVELVLLLDVIEHIEEVETVLETILQHPAIDEHTRFLITVPAYNSLFSAHDVFLKHFRRYNKKSLNQTIETVGLKKIQSHYFFTTLLLPRILTKTLERFNPQKAIRNQKGLGAYHAQPLKDKIITNILYYDYKIARFFNRIGITLPGLSIYTICKKSV